MNQKQFLLHLEHTFKEALALVIKKNADYANKKNPFANFEFAKLVGLSVEDAILVRVSDKLARISNLLRKNTISVKDESIKDTCVDLINYIAILIAYLDKDKSLERD